MRDREQQRRGVVGKGKIRFALCAIPFPFEQVLGREDEGDAIEVIIQANGRVDVVESERCINLARHFEFGTDVEDATIGSK